MKKDIYVPILGLIAGELMIFYGNVFYGLGIHVANLFLTTLIIIFESSLELKMKNILRYILLIILLRMINLSIPQLPVVILQYLLIFGVSIIPIYYIIKDKLVLYRESRIVPKRFYIPLTAVLLIGLIVDILQYELLRPSSDVTYISGKITTMCLIISITITLLLSETKYWNKYASDTIDMSSSSLLSVFIVITAYKIISVP